VTGTSFSFLYGPLVAFAALGVIVLICRWVFAPPSSSRPGATPAATPAASRRDYGLLEPVATCALEDAVLLRDVLRDAGLRATLADGAAPGEVVVLVFRDDAARARALVRG
jgi:hypothetical protein